MSKHQKARKLSGFKEKDLAPATNVPFIAKNGTLQVQAFVHELVAEAFLGPRPDPRMMIRHKDGNKTNNHVENTRNSN